MKKFAAILLVAVASTTALVGCAGNGENTENVGGGVTTGVQKAPVADLLAAIIESGAVRMPMEADETIAQDVYKIDLETVEEYGIAETGISPGPGLVVIAKAKEGQVDAVKANMEALLEAKVGQAFYPAEMEAAEAAEILVDGNYVALFIVNDEVKDQAIALFEESTAE